MILLITFFSFSKYVQKSDEFVKVKDKTLYDAYFNTFSVQLVVACKRK